MASKTKIYIVLELVDGGELFDKIVSLIYSTCYTHSVYLLHYIYVCLFYQYSCIWVHTILGMLLWFLGCKGET